MGFAFEKFTDTAKSFAARLTVRQRTGQLGFNSGSINLYNIRVYRFAVLYFDPEKRAVGVELTNAEGDGAIEIKQRDTNTYIPAKNFLDKFDIDYSKSHTHILRRDAESGLLYILIGDIVEGEEVDREEDPQATR